jgi:AbrB family looped-hinge helix DNA binding protein
MLYSTMTSKGQTTIPSEVREALGLKPGDKLEYSIEGTQVTVRVHQGIRSLKGLLVSTKGKDKSFEDIRTAAAKKARGR